MTDREDKRDIQIGLTRRQAEVVMSALRTSLRKSEAKVRKDPDFVPDQGRFDANKNRIAMLTDVHEQIHRKYRVAYGQPEDNDGSRLTAPRAA